MKNLADRQNVIIYVFILCASVLIIKSAQLQIFDSSYRDQAQRTTLAKKIKYPARGMMYDRNGKLLVANSPIYDIEVIYNNVDPSMDTTLFCSLLDLDRSTFENNLNKNWRDPRYSKSSPFIFLNKIDPRLYARFHEHLFRFPGFYPVIRNIRSYPHSSGAHALGYLSEVTPAEIENYDGLYVNGDIKGKSGLEDIYELDLKGEKGVEYLLKDNLGRDVGPYNNGSKDSYAVSGSDLQLTIDLDLQAYAEELMINKKGAVIALEPSTGEILTMVSSPTYDPNTLSFSRIRGSAFEALSSDTLNKPLYNRAINAKYPPGSIFKPIFSLIALQHGVTYVNRTISCSGVYPITGQKCHAHTTPYNISMAIQHSCNIYFYRLLQDFLDQYGDKNPGQGLDTLVNSLEKFGLGQKLGIDYPYENAGFLPNSRYFDEIYRETAPNGWRSTYVTSLGIGQGEFQLTTLQMANMAAILANRGYYIAPHFIKKYLDGSKDVPYNYQKRNYAGIDAQHFPPVIEGMRRAAESGTARNAYMPDIEVCAKTGTSQNPHGEDHSVFIAFAPKENPKIAIAVFVENAGWGNTFGGAIAGLMLEKYLKGEVSPAKKWLEERMLNADLINIEP